MNRVLPFLMIASLFIPIEDLSKDVLISIPSVEQIELSDNEKFGQLLDKKIDSVLVYYNSREIAVKLVKYSIRYNLPINLLRAVLRNESSFRISASSGKGAVGLMQVMKKTALLFSANNFDLYDVDTNLDFGCRILRYEINKFGVPGGLAGYHGGDSMGRRWISGKPVGKRTAAFVKCVLAEM